MGWLGFGFGVRGLGYGMDGVGAVGWDGKGREGFKYERSLEDSRGWEWVCVWWR